MVSIYKSLQDRYLEFFYVNYVNASASAKYEIFMNIFSENIKKHTPVKKIVKDKLHRNPINWWDEDVIN